MTTPLRRTARSFACGIATLFGLGGCAVLTPLPEPTTLDQRLATLPTKGPGLAQPVTIHWHERAIPFVEAASDRDGFVALGMVHGHLRLGQIELLRHISQGRMAELAGPLAADIDRSVRLLDFGRVARQVVAVMPAEERGLLDAFLEGLNHVQATIPTPPHEYVIGNLQRVPFTAEDLITIGRLASTDVNWLVWFRLLQYRDRPEWPELYARLLEAGTSSVPSIAPGTAALEQVLGAVARTGSNSAAVAGSRSASGSALIASDPHLGLLQPNTWLIAGLKTPSFHMLGLMVPGLPFVAVGRNADIAWGGTNMRSANSDLIDLSDVPESELTVRSQPLVQRWWFDTTATLRDSRFGPVLSDAPLIRTRPGERFALTWIGHRPTDELTAMLRLNRARDWQGFRAALTGFAVSPQNMIFADRHGNIGQVTATMLPRRPLARPADIVQPASAARSWGDIATSADLPAVYNPAAGFVASANNRPADAEIPIGWFFSNDDRITRIAELLGGPTPVTPQTLFDLQRDALKRSAVALRDVITARLAGATLDAIQRDTLQRLSAWDGRYDANSVGAVAFEAVSFHLGRSFVIGSDAAVLEAGGRPLERLASLTEALPADDARLRLAEALRAARPSIDAYPTWGERHRIALQHPLGNLPLIGRRYRFGTLPGAGSNDTLNKVSHPASDQPTVSGFGANARHVSDLGDLDRNWFVLLGGNDGWLNSSQFVDQARDLWHQGGYVQLPLSLEGVRRVFTRTTVVSP